MQSYHMDHILPQNHMYIQSLGAYTQTPITHPVGMYTRHTLTHAKQTLC